MEVIAYVDGSFNQATQTYGAGAVLFVDGDEEHPITMAQADNNPMYAKSRNVAGEVLAASLVIEACTHFPGITKLTIYHDYAGIACWPAGTYKANTKLTQDYRDYVRAQTFEIKFAHVKAHSGITYNEQADALAKLACGL